MRTQSEIQAIAIHQSGVLSSAQSFRKFLAAGGAGKLRVTVGSTAYHSIVSHLEHEIGYTLTGPQRRRLNMICEGKRERSARKVRHQKHGQQALTKFHKGQRIEQTAGVKGSRASEWHLNEKSAWMVGDSDKHGKLPVF